MRAFLALALLCAATLAQAGPPLPVALAAELPMLKPLGEGRVNFSVLIPKLKALGYVGALTIEREISGPQQIEDVKRGIELLSALA